MNLESTCLLLYCILRWNIGLRLEPSHATKLLRPNSPAFGIENMTIKVRHRVRFGLIGATGLSDRGYRSR